MPDETPTEFRTSDLYFAAFLKVSAVPFIDCRKERESGGDGKRVFFYFEKGEGSPIRDLKAVYFGRKPVKVAPLTFVNEIQALKALTHM